MKLEDISTLGKGALTKPISLRDYRLEVIPTAFIIPSNFEVVFGGKIKHQDGSGSCVSQAVSYYAEVLNWQETGKWEELSPRFIYSAIHQTPWGSYIKDNMAYMKNYGIATELSVPSYTNYNDPPSEVFMQNGSDITSKIKEEAMTYWIKDYTTWDRTNLDMYKRAILQGSGCVVASWGNNYCWQNGTILLPDYPKQMEWQHGIYLIGFDDNTKCFKFINSWGSNWGFEGYGYLPYEYVTRGYVSNPFTMIDGNNQIYSLLMKLIGLYKNVISLIKGSK